MESWSTSYLHLLLRAVLKETIVFMLPVELVLFAGSNPPSATLGVSSLPTDCQIIRLSVYLFAALVGQSGDVRRLAVSPSGDFRQELQALIL